jgi:hypothetical protein
MKQFIFLITLIFSIAFLYGQTLPDSVSIMERITINALIFIR